MRTHVSLFAVPSLLALGLGLTACGPDDATAAACISDRFEAQSTSRHVAGTTFHLPTLAEGSQCLEVRWTVQERPAGSEEPVVRGADGTWRITPTTAGTWRLALAGADESEAGEITLEVIDAGARPFTNFNYYPSNSITPVGDELWVANVQTPTITRVEPGTLAILGEHPVGPWPVAIAWREGMDFAVVAQRGDDTLGLVDRESGRLLDSIWVGDEPANVVVSSDGNTAYVALKSENKLAVVDLQRRVRSAVIEVGTDPLALALSDDDATLYVASHRSGQPSRYPYGDDPIADERDLAQIDTTSLEVRRWWLNIGATITSVLLDPSGETLYVSRTTSDTAANLGAPDDPSFRHEVARFDVESGSFLAAADLTRQASSGGHAVSVQGMALAGDTLWVAAEGSDLAIGLDPQTLAEVARADAPGRPRGMATVDGEVYVHGAQGLEVTRIAGGVAAGTVSVAIDHRPELIAAGQRYFTGAGEDYGENWSCNSCHTDGLTDTLIWNAGPFSGRKASRAFTWLEGTYPLGWEGYLSSVDNYAFTVNTNIGVRPTTAEHRALSAYLGSLVPPPAANGLTRRDGTLSQEAVAGKELFEGAGNCASCHPLPLTTSRALLGAGISEGLTDIPSLVGTYRLGTWLKLGQAPTLRSAIDQVTEAFGGENLSADERDSVERYLMELTGRDLFVLASDPRPETASASADQPIQLTFSLPLWNDSDNLARITLVDESGVEVEISRELESDARHVDLSTTSPLRHGEVYTVRIDPELEGFDGESLWVADPEDPQPREVRFTTAAAPALTLSGEYQWTIDMPLANPQTQEFDLENTLTTLVPFTATQTESGAALLVDYGQDLVLNRVAAVDGERVVSPALPIPIGPSFADSTGFQGTLVDLDDDGVGDYAEGTLSISGPGFLESGISWRLTRPSGGACDEGPAGDVAIDITFDEMNLPVIAWGDEPAVGLYIIDPDAQPPAGPGQPVSGGDVYWAVQLESFPDGFVGPVTYGVLPDASIDATEDVGGDAPGAASLVSGQCYKANILTGSFMQGEHTFIAP